MWDTAVQVAAILWGNRLIYFYLFTACAYEPCCLQGWVCALHRSELCVPRADSPPSYTTALGVTRKILIRGRFYGRWKKIWVRLKQLMISSFAVDYIWINFNWGMQLFLSRLRRGWWDVLTSVVLAADLALGTGAAEDVVFSSFTCATESSVPQSSSAQPCCASDHAVLALSEQSLTVTWHLFFLL